MKQFFNVLATLLLSAILFGDTTTVSQPNAKLILTNFNQDLFEIHTDLDDIEAFIFEIEGVATITDATSPDSLTTIVTTENVVAGQNWKSSNENRLLVKVSGTEISYSELNLSFAEIKTKNGLITKDNIIVTYPSFWTNFLDWLFDWQRYVGILGIFAILGITYLMSNNKKKIDFKLVKWGLGLQLTFGIFILITPFGKPIFGWFDTGIKKLLSFSNEGSTFLVKSFVTESVEPSLINFAFFVLPTVVFFSALMAVLYHIGIMQKIIKFVAVIMQKTMGTSGAETTSISANIFVGQTEAPLVIKPFVAKMTKSELMAVMTGGFATVAGGVMAIYVGMLENIPGIAGHLMAASIMSAPAALVIAKIMYPETKKINDEDEPTKLSSNLNEPVEGNALEALGNGATDGLKLAANIAAMLIAILAFVALVNYIMLAIFGITLENLMGYIFMPLAFLMGAPWSESQVLGSLLGQKIVLTELIAYKNLASMPIGPEGISQKTAILASYALCGFANFASIGIQLGGIGAIAPERKKDLAKLVTKAMFGGALASWLTATIAGILI